MTDLKWIFYTLAAWPQQDKGYYSQTHILTLDVFDLCYVNGLTILDERMADGYLLSYTYKLNGNHVFLCFLV